MWRVISARLKRIGVLNLLRLIINRGLTILANSRNIRLRRCRCCAKQSMFLDFSGRDEGIRCIRCGANRRYEMLAEYLRDYYREKLESMVVMELDPESPLMPILDRARRYIRTLYDPERKAGDLVEGGVRNEDITRLSLGDSEVDLLVSSDVLEHVDDLGKAFRETARVLRPGGSHIFTVPYSDRTRRRAFVRGDQIEFLAPPQYHLDPLNPDGVLVFWNIGRDLAEWGPEYGLKIEIAKGPEGPENRVVWSAAVASS